MEIKKLKILQNFKPILMTSKCGKSKIRVRGAQLTVSLMYA